jgi:hypothetical protein
MALTKTTVVAWSGTTLTAGSGYVYSPEVDVRDSYGTVAYVRLVNGATAPTAAARIGITVGCDEQNSGSASFYANACRWVIGMATSSEEYGVSVEIPTAVEWVSFWAGGNTGQNVTAYAAVTKITVPK